MKLAFLAIAFTMTIPLVMGGCVEVHTDMTYDVFEGDMMSIQVYDGGAEVCHGNVRHDLANQDTVFCIDEKDDKCKPGYRICMTHEGKAGTFEYETTVTEGNTVKSKSVALDIKLVIQDLYKQGSYDCQCLGEPEKCRKCREIEACAGGRSYTFEKAALPDCSKPTCKLCDFRGFCK